jgi:hypothetical protein
MHNSQFAIRKRAEVEADEALLGTSHDAQAALETNFCGM